MTTSSESNLNPKANKNTPLKSAISHPSKSCRLCQCNITSGKPRIHIFGPKSRNENLVKRLAVVLEAEIHVHDGHSEFCCQKCYRDFLKFEKVLQQNKQLYVLRQGYKHSTQQHLLNLQSNRQKRCNKDSPTDYKKKPRSVENSSSTTARRTLLPKTLNYTDTLEKGSFIPLENPPNQGPILETCSKTEVRIFNELRVKFTLQSIS